METDDVAHWHELIKAYQKRLRVLELQAASYGRGCPPHILTEIEETQELLDSLDYKVSSVSDDIHRAIGAEMRAHEVGDIGNAVSSERSFQPIAHISQCPYPGMVPFRTEDARFFYGREGEIQQILRLLRHRRYLFIIGPSGSGKSSLIHAGLLPRLLKSHYFPHGYWLIYEMRPGEQPVRALLQALGSVHVDSVEAVTTLLSAQASAQRVLLIIDQFEELFTQADRLEQTKFIATINKLRSHKSCVLLIVMRADFYSDLMSSDLWPVEHNQRLEIAPLRRTALRKAIQQPAADVGVELEAGLLERLLADAADEPGILPLVQETMVLLWDQMIGNQLPLSAYEQLGSEERSGLTVALAAKADATMDDLLPSQQAIARRVFLRLVQFGEGRADTRRQQSVDALQSTRDNAPLFYGTLRHLTDNRLLTMSGDEDDPANRKVDLAHESLISGWPTLQEWLSTWGETERTRRQLEAKVADWLLAGQLLDKDELAEAEHWLSGSGAEELGYSDTLSKLVETSRSAIEKAEEERLALQKLRHALSTDLFEQGSLAEKLQQALSSTCSTLDLSAGFVVILEDNSLRVYASYGHEKLTEALLRYVQIPDEPLVLNNNWPPWPEAHHLFPLRRGNEVFGLLAISGKRSGEPFHETEEESLTLLSFFLTRVLKQVRAQEKEILAISRLPERGRTAQLEQELLAVPLKEDTRQVRIFTGRPLRDRISIWLDQHFFHRESDLARLLRMVSDNMLEHGSLKNQLKATLTAICQPLDVGDGAVVMQDSHGLSVMATYGAAPLPVDALRGMTMPDRPQTHYGDWTPWPAARLLLPLQRGGETLGLLLLGAKRSGQPYREAERAVLHSLGAYLALVIRHARAQQEEELAMAALAEQAKQLRAERELLVLQAEEAARLVAQPRGEPADTAYDLRVFALGPLRAERAGKPIERWGGDKAGTYQAEALFAFLFDRRGRGLTKDEAEELIWHSLELDKADMAFHRTISALRRTLEPGLRRGNESRLITYHHERYWLDPAAIGWCDADAFAGAAEQGHTFMRQGRLEEARECFTRAIGLYRGDYMDDCPFFGDSTFVEARRSELRGQQVDALLALGAIYERLGQAGEAATCYRRAIATSLEECPRAEDGLARLELSTF